MTASGPGRWWWRLSPLESHFEEYTLSYQITLATRAPLNPDHLVQAMRHLFRKNPILRLCYGEKDGDRWFRDMSKEIIDFKEIPGAVTDEVHQSLLDFQYDTTTGPLWCVRLRAEPSCPASGETSGAMPDYPHVSTIFLGIQHGITDGTSNMLNCGWLAHLLDQVIAGTPIDDLQQLGAFVSAERTEKLVEARVDAIANDPQFRTNVLQEIKLRPTTYSLLNRTYEGVGQAENVTRNVIKEYDIATTTAFIQRCKDHGVTVNSAIIALANVAMVDMLVDGGLVQDSYTIHSEQVINARRYWDGDTSNTLGCHLFPHLPLYTATPRTVSEDFWGYAKAVNLDLKDKLVSGYIIQEQAVKRSFLVEARDDIPQPWHAYSISNMGDVTRFAGFEGEHVRVSGVLRGAAVHNGAPNNWAHLVHTFRGRFIHVLSYSTGSITTSMAEKYANRFIHHWKSAMKT